MNERTYISKSGDTWSWDETPEVKKALEDLKQFAGNYTGPLYAPHPDLKNE